MYKNHHSGLQFVSVIVPVFNNIYGIKKCLEGLKSQTYPSDMFEVIVVDNGSLISPKTLVEEFGYKFIEEKNKMNSPYSCRNRGIEEAQGDIIAFTDATCSPSNKWIEEGVKKLKQQDVDIVAGDIVFDINAGSTPGEMYDSLVNVRMEESVRKRRVAKGGNLFIPKQLFYEVGFFEEGLRSGGDVRWTGRAVAFGKGLEFSKHAFVVIEPRKLLPLISKQFRVSKGMPQIWREQGGFIKNFINKGLLLMLPPNPFQLLYFIKSNKTEYMKRRIISLFLIGYLLRIVSGFGVWMGLGKIKWSKSG